MSGCACPHCDCDCDECLPAPTAEELAEEKAREEQRLADRWTPARDQTQQDYRDIEAMTRAMAEDLERAFFYGGEVSGFSGWTK